MKPVKLFPSVKIVGKKNMVDYPLSLKISYVILQAVQHIN